MPKDRERKRRRRKFWSRADRDLNKAVGRREIAETRMERAMASGDEEAMARHFLFGVDAELDILALERRSEEIRALSQQE